MPDLDYIQQQGLPGFRYQPGATIGGIISDALPYVFMFAGILLLIYFIIGGYKLMFSGGDPKKVAEGQTTITHAVIGFIIVFAAFWITQIIAQFLGLNTIFNVFGGNPRPGGV